MRNAEEVTVTGTGGVYVAEVGTPFPTSISDPIDPADWEDLGYVSEEGARFSFSRNMNEIMAWQDYDPIRIVAQSIPKEISFDLMQWNGTTMRLGLGGGTVVETSPGEYVYEPPDAGVIDEKALIIAGTDGDDEYRFLVRRSMNMAGAEFAFVRENPVLFPITMKVLAAGTDKPFEVQTNADWSAYVGS